MLRHVSQDILLSTLHNNVNTTVISTGHYYWVQQNILTVSLDILPLHYIITSETCRDGGGGGGGGDVDDDDDDDDNNNM